MISKEQLVNACAQAAHEMNRIFCEAHGDSSQVPWKDAPEWQKESAHKGVQFALAGSTPEKQHEAWCKDKLDNGWKYGLVKDADKKEHPCLIPYDKLPEEQKLKDRLYILSVLSMAKVLESSNV